MMGRKERRHDERNTSEFMKGLRSAAKQTDERTLAERRRQQIAEMTIPDWMDPALAGMAREMVAEMVGWEAESPGVLDLIAAALREEA